jgi:hypothetical protein
MPDISIKNVPKRELESIRAQAKRNHRSLQGQLRVIISEAAKRQVAPTFEEAVAKLKHIALKTPSEAARMMLEDRDGH